MIENRPRLQRFFDPGAGHVRVQLTVVVGEDVVGEETSWAPAWWARTPWEKASWARR